jgi:uncharacterized repeat protein (TIGR02543 family)
VLARASNREEIARFVRTSFSNLFLMKSPKVILVAVVSAVALILQFAMIAPSAQSAQPTHTATFMANGGTGVMAPLVENKPTDFTANTFTRVGYTFAGWNTAGDGTGTAYIDQFHYHFNSDITLYAQWTLIPVPPTVINIAAISGVTAPVANATPVSTITESAQYTGTVTWAPSVSTFGYSTIYVATITLTAKSGFTLTGVTSNFFTVAGATTSNSANSGVVTATFPATAAAPPTVIDIAAISGVTAPVANATPVSTITETAQYTGAVTWAPSASTFGYSTIYVATITLTAKTGFTLTGVTSNFFTVAGATASNSANSGVITATFPATAAAPPASHTVTFLGNGSTSGSTDPQVASTATALRSNGFVRSGYTFYRWNTSADGLGTWVLDGATYDFATDKTLYAIWTVIPPTSHTVTFDGNGATAGSMATQSSNTSTTLSLNSFTKTSLRFMSWNTLATGAGVTYADGASYDFSADLTLYAVWGSLPTHTITFNANGGGGTMANQVSSVPAVIASNTFTRSGFTFHGWWVTPTGGTEYDRGDTFAFDTDITLYAEWSLIPDVPTGGGSPAPAAPVVVVPPTYTVIFDGNGAANGSMAPQESVARTRLNKVAFTRDGYLFDHWSTNPSVDGTLYDDEANYSFAANVTLYAHWSQKISHQVTFSNNGALPPTTSTQHSVEPAALISNSYLRAGHQFLGWSTALDGSGDFFADGATFSFGSDIKLFAQWRLIPFEAILVSQNQPYELALKSNESKVLHIAILFPDWTVTPATVVIPSGIVGLDGTVRITPVFTPQTVLLGMVTLKVEILDNFGAVIPQLRVPITINFLNTAGDNIVAQSSDGFIWTPVPLLAGTTLPEGQEDGYYIDSDGVVVIVSTHLTQFGMRRAQNALFQATVSASRLLVGTVGSVAASGGSGTGSIRYNTSTPTICSVSSTGAVKGLQAGSCLLTATRGGDVFFLHSTASQVRIQITEANKFLSVHGKGAVKKLYANFGEENALSTLSIEIVSTSGNVEVVTYGLDINGRGEFTISAPSGSTLRAQFGSVRVATLKVA